MHSQVLLCFQARSWVQRSVPRPHLESREDPGNEDDFTNEQIEINVMSKQVAMAMTKVVVDTIYLPFEVYYLVKVFIFHIFFLTDKTI